jgi:aminopeptidase N
VKDNPDVVAALGNAAQRDPFWGIRSESLEALGNIGGPDAEKQIIAGLHDDKPWVREVAVEQLGEFKGDSTLGSKLAEIAATDKAYSVRAAALEAVGELNAPNAFETLTDAVKSQSPDDTLRNGGLEGLGALGDDRAVPLLLEWSAPGKDFDTRRSAIRGLALLDPKNKAITQTLISYLQEPYIDIKLASIFALTRRGDPDAIPALEALVKSGDLALGTGPMIQSQIDALKAKAAALATPAGTAPPPAQNHP